MQNATSAPHHAISSSTQRSAAILVAIAAAFYVACDEGDGVVVPVNATIDLELVAEGLTAPVLAIEAPDDSDRLFVLDQAGTIRIVTADGDLLNQPFLDVRNRLVNLNPDFDERGLLGLAFHPDFAANGRFFVYYSAPLRAGAPSGYNHTAHIAEYTVSSNPDLANHASERILLQVDEPQFNHNGGTIAFGPDGYLYIALGDGGGADDTGTGHVSDWYDENAGGNGQDIEDNLLGSILRIDVNGGQPYEVPGDNPFVGETGRDEIWAYGFRNPYRFSFDMLTGDLIVGDVGQNRWEEIDLVERGGNYGWNVMEATHCFDTDNPDADAASCPDEGGFGEPLIDPVIEYANANAGGLGIAVVGGFVYRGEEIPSLEDTYIFGDYSHSASVPDGIVFVALPAGQSTWAFEELRFGPNDRSLGAYLLGFGQDLKGEVYVLTSERSGPTGSTGAVYRLVRE